MRYNVGMERKSGNGICETFSSHWLTIRPSLFNFIEDEVGELDEEQRLFVRVAESLELRQVAARYGWCGNGRRPSSRLAIFKLLLMKHVWNWPETKDALGEVRRSPALRRLCGWEAKADIPSESTVSRAFAAFALDKTADDLLARFVGKIFKGRIVLHRSMDSTEIDARERPATKVEKADAAKSAAVKAQVDANAGDFNAPAAQRGRDLDANVSLLPTLCDWGCKRNSKGKTQFWRGEPKPDCRGERFVHVVPAEKVRFRNRTGVERVYGHLHDAHGGRHVRVRGHAKVFLHLLLGLLVIAVEQASAAMLC